MLTQFPSYPPMTYYKNNILKGEIVVMLYAKEQESESEEELKTKINILKEDGFSPKDISKIISKLYGENKNKIYKLAIE